MSDEEYLSKRKSILKRTLSNIYFYLLIVLFILSAFYTYMTSNQYGIYACIILLVLIFINVIIYLLQMSKLNKDKSNKNGNSRYGWDPLILTNQEFIKVAKTGLPKTYIEINGTTHEIEVILSSARIDTVKIEKVLIDGIEFNRLEDALNFPIYAGLTINTMNEIKVLSSNNSNPIKFFR